MIIQGTAPGADVDDHASIISTECTWTFQMSAFCMGANLSAGGQVPMFNVNAQQHTVMDPVFIG